MLIVEGFLPLTWCIIWTVISLIFIVIGIVQIRRAIREIPQSKGFLGFSALFMLIMTVFNFPSLYGTTSTPYGNAVSGSVFGPFITSVLAFVVLLIQAFLFANGGITTLGANIFAYGIVGPFVAYLIYHGFKKLNIPVALSILVTPIFSCIFSTLTTALQIALVYGSFVKIIIISIVTQFILGIADLFLSIFVFLILYAFYEKSDIFSRQFDDFLTLK